MEKYIGQDFDFQVSIVKLVRKLRLENDPEDEDFQRATQMLAEALACARPKFAYTVAAIEAKGDDFVIVEGHRLESPLVRRNLDKVHRIVPYVATCGVEVDNWSHAFTDMVEHYWADAIKNMILVEAVAELRQTVLSRFFPGSRLAGDHADAAGANADAAGVNAATAGVNAATDGANAAAALADDADRTIHAVHAGDMAKMSPGSLPEWPVTQQPILFSLLDGLPAEIGVRLTDSCLMLPSKSVSGFFFASQSNFVNCRFCPILSCPNRSARYQPTANQ